VEEKTCLRKSNARCIWKTQSSRVFNQWELGDVKDTLVGLEVNSTHVRHEALNKIDKASKKMKLPRNYTDNNDYENETF
jgi:hypothetical protein